MRLTKRIQLQLLALHQKFCVSAKFYALHEALYLFALQGLGVFNYQNHRISGEQAFLKHLLTKLSSPTIFDVGANSGGYAKLCKKYSSSASIFCFEPHPTVFQSLLKESELSGFVAVPLGCSDTSGRALFYDYAEEDGSTHASIYKDVIEVLHRSRTVTHEVELTTIDAYMKKAEIQSIDLLKIDTEGHELATLKGAVEALSKGAIRVIHFEFNEMNIVSHSTLLDFISLLKDFELFRMLPDGIKPIRLYPRVYSEIYGFQNIVAIQKLDTELKTLFAGRYGKLV